MERLAYSVSELAAMVGKSPATVRRYIRDGLLRARRFGGGFMISAEAVKEFLGEAPTESATRKRSMSLEERDRLHAEAMAELGF